MRLLRNLFAGLFWQGSLLRCRLCGSHGEFLLPLNVDIQMRHSAFPIRCAKCGAIHWLNARREDPAPIGMTSSELADRFPRLFRPCPPEPEQPEEDWLP